MNLFEMRWPVLDPAMPEADLIAEASADLGPELAGLGLRPLSAPVFSFVVAPKLNRHAGPFLVARLAVSDYERTGRV